LGNAPQWCKHYRIQLNGRTWIAASFAKVLDIAFEDKEVLGPTMDLAL